MQRLSWLTIFIVLYIGSYAYGWSWLHTVTHLDMQQKIVRKNDEWCWERKHIPAFSQLIFSWNAFRPEKGYFTFWVQVRDKLTHHWYAWHRMAQWGKNIQRSFTNMTHRGTEFHYVRLELPGYHCADSFRIRITAHAGAVLNSLHHLAVNTVNLRIFASEITNRALYKLPSVFIAQVPRRSQMIVKHPRFFTLCSPTSTSMLLSYLLKRDFKPKDVAQGVYDGGLQVYGSWPFNTAHAYELSKGKFTFHVERLRSFTQLHDYLKKSIPVIVSIRGPVKGGALPYTKGHLLVVIGYDRKLRKIICHDPAFASNKQTRVSYDLADFLQAWERSRRLSYVAQPQVLPKIIKNK